MGSQREPQDDVNGDPGWQQVTRYRINPFRVEQVQVPRERGCQEDKIDEINN